MATLKNEGTFEGSPKAMIEIIAKQKGCMLCDLAIGVLEEIAPQLEKG